MRSKWCVFMQLTRHLCCSFLNILFSLFVMTSTAGSHIHIFSFYSRLSPPSISQWFHLIYTNLISSHSKKHSHPSPAPQARYVQAKLSVHDRSLKVATVIESLEMEMELLCLTGVEDQLQTDVRPTLEILRNAGIKVWGVDSSRLIAQR